MKRIKLVCFDVGGTLVYDHRSKYEKAKFLEKYGVQKNINIEKIRAETFDKKVHQDIDKVIISYMENIKVKMNKEEFFKKFKKDTLNYHRRLRCYKESKSVLINLREKGYKIAFITNWNQYARDHFEIIGLTKYANHMVISAEHGKRKPHLSLFKKVLRIFKVKPSEALMIGDKYEKDYLPAKSIGMHALLINRKHKRTKKSINNLKQVLGYLSK